MRIYIIIYLCIKSIILESQQTHQKELVNYN